MISDGTVQTYRLRLDFFAGRPPPEEPIRQIALRFWAGDDLASIDILSITLIPKVANYADAGAAARTEIRNRIYRRCEHARRGAPDPRSSSRAPRERGRPLRCRSESSYRPSA